MVLIFLAVIAAGLAGLIVGRQRTTDEPRPPVRLRWWALLLAALVGQAVIGMLPSAARGAIAAADCVAVAAWALANRPRRSGIRGLPVLAAGCVLNSVVIAVNDGMPVSRWAMRVAGLPRHLDVTKGHLDKHVIMTGSTSLRWLGDVLPVPALGTVMSAGDVLMVVGAAAAAFSAALALGPRHRLGSTRPNPLGSVR